MIYGITGNTSKDNLWDPAASLMKWMMQQELEFRMTEDVAEGIAQRGLLPDDICRTASTQDVGGVSDIILSFGGDGTFLHTARQLNGAETPILGVNIGRLGFLAEIETAEVQDAIRRIERHDYHIERRACLQADVQGEAPERHFALNEFVLERSGRAGLIAIEVWVDDVSLNNYWADGIIISTPTGSTAYSLSVGGPIVAPLSGVIVIAPIASHSLTVRPIVLSDRSVVRVRVETARQAFVLAADGQSIEYSHGVVEITIRRAERTVNLVRLPDRDYFQTLRNKLMWGARKGRD